MCRIAGIINKNQATQLLNNVKLMCTIMAHGGPDDEGFFYLEDEGLAFGHRRLAIIDLSTAGHQPMHYLDKKYTITFNGEIYNYLTLKEELQNLGYTFHTKSDTEVILAGFACWGTASFERLNGMFAFALYDKPNNLTYLVRDHQGIKPLYYSITANQLIFASEVKAFKHLIKEENKDWKIYFLAFGHIPEPYTTLNNVLMLPKAHYLKWDHETNSNTICSFNKEQPHALINNSHKAVIEVKQKLNSAVKRHLIADAPLGIFLSGGIDSSLITLLADETQDNNTQSLHTLSVNFDDAPFSEEEFQKIILKKVTTQHSAYTLDQQTFSTHFPTALSAMDQPTADGINSWFINYFAKTNGLKAVLSGVGADELFGGYPSFGRMGIVNFLSKLPSIILKKCIKLNSTLVKRAYYLSYKNTVGKYLFLRGFFTPDEISLLLDIPISTIDHVLKNIPIPEMPKALSATAQASWLETNLYMQNQLLKDTDFMSMQHGVEVRVPFLDKEFLQSVQSIDDHIKHQKKKQLLIDSFITCLPRKIWDRPKMGFTFPFQQWLKEDNYFQTKLATYQNNHAKALITNFKMGKLHWSKAMVIFQAFNHAD